MGDWRVDIKKLHTQMTTAVNRWFHSFWIPSDYFRHIPGRPDCYLCGSEDVLVKKYNEINGENIQKVGYAGLSNPTQIWVVVHRVKKSGKVIPNQFVLGHEYQHWLNLNTDIVTNPDQVKEKDKLITE